MGLLDGLKGNAREVDARRIENEMDKVLVDGEIILRAYQVIRDMFVFTNKRFIMVDKQGMSGAKVNYTSIPYKSISRFSVESAGGLFDADAEIRLWISGGVEPIKKELAKGVDIVGIQKMLAAHVIGDLTDSASSSFQNIWHYLDSANQQTGPISENDILKMIASKKLTGSSMVWKTGMANWVKLSEAGMNGAKFD